VRHSRRLYWEDPYRTRFDATIVERLERNGRPAVVLEATCFYPTSGGQPHDTGRLGEARVVEVMEEDERIVHVLDRHLSEDAVSGVVDWERRFDHMQQHSGQHILSAAFERCLDAETVSFHLGEEISTIDLNLGELSPVDAAAVEDAANRVVFENRPVTVGAYSGDEAAKLPLRRPPTVEGSVRVVQVQDYDASACGGTHVQSTGEIGLVHIRRWGRSRGHVRVDFLCGWRALRALRERNTIVQTLANELSVGSADLIEAVNRLAEAERDARRNAEDLGNELLEYRLADLERGAEPFREGRLVSRVLKGVDAAGMRYAAQRLIQQPGMVVLLATAGPSAQVVFGRSGDVTLDVAALLRDTLGKFGGRGGGQPHLAQGGGVDARDLPAILAEAKSRLTGSE